MLPKKAPLIVAKWCASITLLQPYPELSMSEGGLQDAEDQLGSWSWMSDLYLLKEP